MDEFLDKQVRVCKKVGGRPITDGRFECEGVELNKFNDAMKKEDDF